MHRCVAQLQQLLYGSWTPSITATLATLTPARLLTHTLRLHHNLADTSSMASLPNADAPPTHTRSYTTFYLTRGSLTYSAPLLLADKSLGLTITDIGAMTSIFPMAYGVSKVRLRLKTSWSH